MNRCSFYLSFMWMCSAVFAQPTVDDDPIFTNGFQERRPEPREHLLKSLNTTINQAKYDITYYSIDIQPVLETETIYGKVNIIATVVSTTLNKIELDFRGLFTISDVHLSGYPDIQLVYSYNHQLLSVSLGSTFIVGDKISLEIAYHGTQDIYPFFQTYYAIPAISLYWGPYWFPCKDDSDRADSADITITVPGNLKAVSNGYLKEILYEDNTATYWWQLRYPSSATILGVEIYAFEEHIDDYIYNEGADTMKIYFFNYPGNYEKNRSLLDSVKAMLTYFSSRFGEYPFVGEKLAIVDVPYSKRYSAYANHSMICMTENYESNVLAHEISHQWWGGLVSIPDLHHVWLEEGFASYSEALWYEHENESDPLLNASAYVRTNHFYTGRGTVYAEDTEHLNKDLIYRKASYVLHMLRHIVGDSVFFEILEAYDSPDNYGYKSATTEDFQRNCEEVSGIDLGQFFHQWIYEEYYPFYLYRWEYLPFDGRYRIDLEIDQAQKSILESAPIFGMPVDIKVTTGNTDTTITVWDTLGIQSFEFLVDKEPSDLMLDAGNWILKRDKNITGLRQSSVPDEPVSMQCFPNPISTSSIIKYNLPDEMAVEVSLYDFLGRKVATLLKESQPPGTYEIPLNAGELPNGVYFCILDYGFSSVSRKLVILAR